MRPDKIAQTTDHELRFINNLGKYAKTGASRDELLIGYLQGCRYRTNWGAMNRKVIILHAVDALRGELK